MIKMFNYNNLIYINVLKIIVNIYCVLIVNNQIKYNNVYIIVIIKMMMMMIMMMIIIVKKMNYKL